MIRAHESVRARAHASRERAGKDDEPDTTCPPEFPVNIQRIGAVPAP